MDPVADGNQGESTRRRGVSWTPSLCLAYERLINTQLFLSLRCRNGRLVGSRVTFVDVVLVRARFVWYDLVKE